MHGICRVSIVMGICLTTCILSRADREAEVEEVEEVDGVEDREAADHLTPLIFIGISKSYVAA